MPTFHSKINQRSSVDMSARLKKYRLRNTRDDARGNLQPSTFNLQPSTFNLQPSTFNLQPSTFNLQPSTQEGQEAAADLLDVGARVEGGDPEKPLASGAESRARGDDHLSLGQHLVKHVP